MKPNGLKIFLAALCFLMIAFAAHATYYKWRDDNGVLHFGESPPQEFIHRAVPYDEVIPAPSQGASASEAAPSQAADDSSSKKAAPEPAAPSNPETPVEIRNNSVIVPVTLKSFAGNSFTAHLVLDTGASDTTIYTDVAVKAGAYIHWRGHIEVAGGGKVMAGVASFSLLKVGPYTADNFKLVVIPHPGTHRDDGLLGNDFLRQINYRVDYKRKCIVWLGKSTSPQ